MLAQIPPKSHGYLLLLLILALLLLGLALMLLLSWLWRRFNQRQAGRSARRELMPDLWQAGGDRLAARLDQQHPPARGGPEAVPDDELPLDPEEQELLEDEDDGEEPPGFEDDDDEDDDEDDAEDQPPRR